MTLVWAALCLWASAALPEPAWAEAMGVPWLGAADTAVIQSILEYEVTGVTRALPESGASFTITSTDLSDGICRSFVVEQRESVAQGVACRAASGGWSARGSQADALSAAGPAAGPSAVTADGRGPTFGSSTQGTGSFRVRVARNAASGEVRTVISPSGDEQLSTGLPDDLADWDVVVTTVIPPTLPTGHPMRQGSLPRPIGLADLVEHAVPAVGGSAEPLVPAPPARPGP